jgi:hypothetical protein
MPGLGAAALGWARHGLERPGKAGTPNREGGAAASRRCSARPVGHTVAPSGTAGAGGVGLGGATPGLARRGYDGQGKAPSRRGGAADFSSLHCPLGPARSGKSGLGMAGYGVVRPAWARQGSMWRGGVRLVHTSSRRMDSGECKPKPALSPATPGWAGPGPAGLSKAGLLSEEWSTACPWAAPSNGSSATWPGGARHGLARRGEDWHGLAPFGGLICDLLVGLPAETNRRFGNTPAWLGVAPRCRAIQGEVWPGAACLGSEWRDGARLTRASSRRAESAATRNTPLARLCMARPACAGCGSAWRGSAWRGMGSKHH